MPGNKVRTLKKIRGEVEHPYSRKATQMHRALNRTDKLNAKKSKHQFEKISPIVERFVWFKHAMDPEMDVLSVKQVEELILSYIERNDAELEELKAMHRKGRTRPKAAREDAIILLKKKDLAEFESGFLVPDLSDAENVKILR